MSRYYYFAATLPSLAFGAQSPMTGAEFLERCRIHLIHDDSALVAATVLSSESDSPPKESRISEFLSTYYTWERSLRNALVILRSHRSGKSGEKWLKPSRRNDDSARAAGIVFQAGTPLEGEISLERERWTFID